MQTFPEEKSAYFRIWNIFSFMDVGKLGYYFDPKDPLSVSPKKSWDGFLIKTTFDEHGR